MNDNMSKLKKLIDEVLNKHLNESQIESLIKTSAVPYFKNKIEGGFLNKKQAEDLQKEIESNYIDDIGQHFRREKDDIRMKIFNYDNPIAEKDINGVNLRIAEGLLRNKRKTYLLYADGKIVGEFYSVEDIKKIIKYIEDHLIKNISNEKI